MKCVRIIAFATLAIMVAWGLNKILWHKAERAYMIEEFYCTDAEYDVLAFGPSYMYCTICPFELFRQYNLRAFDLCTPDQPINETYYFIRRALQKSPSCTPWCRYDCATGGAICSW